MPRATPARRLLPAAICEHAIPATPLIRGVAACRSTREVSKSREAAKKPLQRSWDKEGRRRHPVPNPRRVSPRAAQKRYGGTSRAQRRMPKRRVAGKGAPPAASVLPAEAAREECQRLLECREVQAPREWRRFRWLLRRSAAAPRAHARRRLHRRPPRRSIRRRPTRTRLPPRFQRQRYAAARVCPSAADAAQR